MSVSSGLFLHIQNVAGPSDVPPSVRLLRALLELGWRADDHGRTVFLPQGDRGAFDWQSRSREEEPRVWQEIESMALLGETVGVVLTWEGTQIGGEFLISAELTMTVSFSSHRRKTQSELTDVTWYLERIVPALRSVASITEVSWREAL